jgi:hypothetical protein
VVLLDIADKVLYLTPFVEAENDFGFGGSHTNFGHKIEPPKINAAEPSCYADVPSPIDVLLTFNLLLLRYFGHAVFNEIDSFNKRVPSQIRQYSVLVRPLLEHCDFVFIPDNVLRVAKLELLRRDYFK